MQGGKGVPFGVRMAPDRSLHRLRDESTAAAPDEQLGRGGAHGPVAEVEVGSVVRPLCPDQVGEQAERVAAERRAQPDRVVHLVGLTGGDQLPDGPDRGQVGGMRAIRHPGADVVAAAGGGPGRRQRSIEDAEGDQRHPADPGGSDRLVEGRTGVVRDHADDPAPGGGSLLGGPHGIGDVTQLLGDDRVDGSVERDPLALAIEGVLEERPSNARRGHGPTLPPEE